MPPKKKSKKRPRRKISREDLLEDDRRDEILLTFKHALNKGEKTLSLSRAKKSLKTLGIDAKTDEIQSFFGDDKESVEELDKSLFLRFAASKMIQIEDAHKAFGLIDQDKKGVVVLEDLQRVAQELGEDFSEEELAEMMELADRSGDGLLRPKDFVRIARKIDL